MNSSKRAVLRKACTIIREATQMVNLVFDQEEESYSNVPETISLAEKYVRMQDNLEMMEDAVAHLDDAVDVLEAVISN